MAWCADNFSINVTGSVVDADLTIPGDFPIRVEAGAMYFIGFTYVTGAPAATGWTLQWEIFDDDGNELMGESSPSSTIMPDVPIPENAPGLKNGSVRGTLPTPMGNRLYIATLTILQT